MIIHSLDFADIADRVINIAMPVPLHQPRACSVTSPFHTSRAVTLASTDVCY